MARYNDRNRVTSASMRSHATVLRALADTHELLAQQMDAVGLPSVDALNMKTGVLGLVNLGKFLGAVVQAYTDNAAAKGIGELVGATAEIRKLTNRAQDEAFQDLPVQMDGDGDEERIAREAAATSESLTKKKPRRPKK